MLWIGMYIALASLCCILAMMADLVHGIKTRKLWFPCKYFHVNAASLTVIAVAMKLPVDLSGSMPGDVDQLGKLGSMAFMCTMMANLLPCLATMNSNELLTNITALGLLVITMVVNVCIQIETGVISYKEDARLLQTVAKKFDIKSLGVNKNRNTRLATTYVILLLWLLIIHVSSCLAILKSKKIMESKYQQGHEIASKDVQQSKGEILTVDKLHKHVSNYWIMSGSGSPQFILACSVTTAASGVICVTTAILHIVTVSTSISSMLKEYHKSNYKTISDMLKEKYDSDYKWSMVVILIVQFFGVIIGTLAPLCRCFATLSFKESNKSILNHMKVYIIESYWTQKLYDWKQASIRFRSHKLKVVINTLKNQILNFCIEFQIGVVVVCKTLALIPFFFVICFLYCAHCMKWLLPFVFRSSEERGENLEQSQYVLQLGDEMELAKRTLEGLLKSRDRLIKKGVNKRPDNLRILIEEKSTVGFKGVKSFDNGHYVPYLPLKVEYHDCWSLPVVTLTTIAINLPNIQKIEVENLLKSVREGLEYVTLVEENLNTTKDYVNIQKTAETLWQEVDVSKKWLGNKWQEIACDDTSASQTDTTLQIVQSFFKKAKNKIKELESMDNIRDPNSDSNHTIICAYSMCRVTKTIMDEKESLSNTLFDKLSSNIADIMAACLTNLPQVIAMKCHTSAIEKRQACVQAAAQLLGETTEIINIVQGRYSSNMNPDDLPFIDKWRAYLSDP
ncbi:hypothetical protein R6Q59_013282 [Mikania micrantha]